MTAARPTRGGPGRNGRVRTQCDFRPGADGPEAWDIDHIIAPGSDLPVCELALETLADMHTDLRITSGPTPTVRGFIDQVRLCRMWTALIRSFRARTDG
jgi:hypothetical protein